MIEDRDLPDIGKYVPQTVPRPSEALSMWGNVYAPMAFAIRGRGWWHRWLIRRGRRHAESWPFDGRCRRGQWWWTQARMGLPEMPSLFVRWP